MNVTRQGIAKFLKRYLRSGHFGRQPGSCRPTKITLEVQQFAEEAMQKDDETTAVQLHGLLNEKGINLSLNTILRSRSKLGWTFRGSAYCQLIRPMNKDRRLQWALKFKDDALHDRFKNVIWTDECTIQAETNRRFCCRKVGQCPTPKPR